MSYKTTAQTKTVCDRCGTVKRPEGEAPWSIWVTPGGHTWHHCPKCIKEISDLTLDDLMNPIHE